MCVSFLWPSPKFPTLFSVYFQYVPWENLQFEAQILYPCTLKVVGSHSWIVFLTWCSHKPSMSPKTLTSPQILFIPTNLLRPHKPSTSTQIVYVPTNPLRLHKPWCPHKPSTSPQTLMSPQTLTSTQNLTSTQILTPTQDLMSTQNVTSPPN